MMLLAGCGGGGDSGGDGAGTSAPTAQASADETVPAGTPTTLDGSASDLPSGAPHRALQGVRSNQSKGQLWLIIFNEFSVRKW